MSAIARRATAEEQRRNRRSQAGTFKIPPAKRHEIQTKKSPFAARTFENQSNLWGLFVRVLKNQGDHTEAIKSRYELLLIPAKRVWSGRRKIVKLAVESKFASFLKQACQRLEEWLGQTAPQLSLSMGKAPPWLLFA